MKKNEIFRLYREAAMMAVEVAAIAKKIDKNSELILSLAGVDQSEWLDMYSLGEDLLDKNIEAGIKAAFRKDFPELKIEASRSERLWKLQNLIIDNPKITAAELRKLAGYGPAWMDGSFTSDIAALKKRFPALKTTLNGNHSKTNYEFIETGGGWRKLAPANLKGIIKNKTV